MLRGNTFINYEDPEQAHRGALQGIGCFDGTLVDWLVENNVAMTDHWRYYLAGRPKLDCQK